MNTSILETYEKYTRNDIMALTGDDLLNYVNTMLQNGYTFQALCDAKGLRNKTIRQRLRKLCGAVYDQKLKYYIKDSESSQSDYSDNILPIYSEQIDDIFSSQQQYDYDTPISQYTTEGQTTEKAIIEDLKECIVNLTHEIICLNDTMSIQYQRQQETPPARKEAQEFENFVLGGKFEAIPFTGQPKTRPVKIYPEILERLDAFCLKYPQYSKQRVISTLLSHALDMYE